MKYLFALVSLVVVVGCAEHEADGPESGSLTCPEVSQGIVQGKNNHQHSHSPPPNYSIAVPTSARWFYVSDAYTINILAPVHWHYPGVANSPVTFKAGQTVDVYVLSASFALLPFGVSSLDGYNVDVRMGVYDVSTSPVTFKRVVNFSSEYGSSAPGLFLNATSSGGTVVRAEREFGTNTPMKLTFKVPSDWKGVYQVGPVIQFHSGTSTCAQYEYHVHGAINVR